MRLADKLGLLVVHVCRICLVVSGYPTVVEILHRPIDGEAFLEGVTDGGYQPLTGGSQNRLTRGPSRSSLDGRNDTLKKLTVKESLMWKPRHSSQSANESHLIPRIFGLGFPTEFPVLIHKFPMFDNKAYPTEKQSMEFGTSSSVVIIAIGAFFGGVLMITVLGIVLFVYFRRRRRTGVPVRNGEDCPKHVNILPEDLPHRVRPQVKPKIVHGDGRVTTTDTENVLSSYTGRDNFSPGDLLSVHRNAAIRVAFDKNEEYSYNSEFADFVTCNGGEIKSPESNVSVIIPKGAIGSGQSQQVIVRVCLHGQLFDGRTVGPQGTTHLSPIVHILTPHLDRYDKPFIVRIPHRACVSPKSSWNFKLLGCRDNVGLTANSTWEEVIGNQFVNARSLSYTVDSHYIYVRTFYPGAFMCHGARSPNSALRLCSVVYGNSLIVGDRQQVNTRIYICDTILDTQKRVFELERVYNGVQLSAHVPLDSSTCDGDWTVALETASDPSWPWQIPVDNKVKVITVEQCYYCFGTPAHAHFQCMLKNPKQVVLSFQSYFTVKAQSPGGATASICAQLPLRPRSQA